MCCTIVISTVSVITKSDYIIHYIHFSMSCDQTGSLYTSMSCDQTGSLYTSNHFNYRIHFSMSCDQTGSLYTSNHSTNV